jgi:hypothetical protein
MLKESLYLYLKDEIINNDLINSCVSFLVRISGSSKNSEYFFKLNFLPILHDVCLRNIGRFNVKELKEMLFKIGSFSRL